MSNRRQPQRLPPPLTHGVDPIDAAVVLLEFPGVLGLSLWKAVRSVRLWSEVGETERARAFGRGSHAARLRLLEAEEVPGELQGLLARAAAVLQPRARAVTVANACRGVAEWAEARDALGTALEFMQAAAMALPGDAELAYESGRLARARGEYTRAENWYRHAVARARRGNDRFEFARGYLGLGTVFLVRGAHSSARRSLIRGLRAAKRFSLRPLVAEAYQALAVLSIRSDRPAEVARYVKAAVGAAEEGSPALAALAGEVAGYLLDEGYAAEARRLLDTVPERAAPGERLGTLAHVARAAAATGDCERYSAAWAEVESILAGERAVAPQPHAMLALARAAATAGQIDRAGQKARLARQEAATVGEERLAGEAAELLGSIEEGGELRLPELRVAPAGVLGVVEILEAALS